MAKAGQVQVRRVYDPPEPDDGKRVLVDRLWPRGLSKERAHLDDWCKEIAPSTKLHSGTAMIPTGTPSSSAAIAPSSPIQSVWPRSAIFASWPVRGGSRC